MQIADETAHQLLAYVSGVSRQGHRLTVEEFEAYAKAPDRRSTAQAFQKVFGLMSTETSLEWLVRLKWLALTNGIVTMTDLGRAALQALDESVPESETPSIVVLDAEDPFAYALAVAEISRTGADLLADPWLKLEQLPHIVQYTAVTRLLVGKKAKAAELALALANLPEERRPQARVNPDFHDRFAIPSAGEVLGLGTSLNGIGKRTSVMSTIKPPAADVVRREYEKLWTAGTPLAPPSGPGQAKSHTKQRAKAKGR